MINPRLYKHSGNVLSILNSFRYKVAGLGVSAFNRIVPGYFLPEFINVCALNSLDYRLISREQKSKCLFWRRRDILGYPGSDTNRILASDQFKKFVLGHKIDYLTVYRVSFMAQKLCHQYGIKLIGNSPQMVNWLEQKRHFLPLCQKLKIDLIPGEEFDLNRYREINLALWQKKYGRKVVIQISDMTKGGGAGFHIITNKEDLSVWQKKVIKIRHKYQAHKARVAPYIPGQAPSMTGCITRHGLLTSQIRARPIGIPQLVGDSMAGAFCGHDWYYLFPAAIRKQAESIAGKIGQELALKGYKGIFGIDFLLDEQKQKLYPTECNPRHLGTEPVSSLAQMERGEVPVDLFDLLEHLDLNYQIDFKATKKQYLAPKKCSQLLLYNRTGCDIVVKKALLAGVHTLKQGKLVYLRPGFANWDIKQPSEFIITDRVPRPGVTIKPGAKLVRLVFKQKVLMDRFNLLPAITDLVEKIYHYYGI